MIASSWWKVSLGLIGVTGLLASSGAGCGSSTSSSSTDGTTTSTTGSGGAGGGSGGTGGASGTGGDVATTSSTTTTTSSTTTTTTTSSTSSTGTGMSKYADCASCTNVDKGAPADECNATHDACFANKNCVQLYNCAYFNPGCNTDASGACCTFDCYETLKTTVGDPVAAQAAIDLYHAYDACLYCTTCTTQCDAQEYCAAYAAGPAACAN
jgi:hypothetical protein